MKKVLLIVLLICVAFSSVSTVAVAEESNGMALVREICEMHTNNADVGNYLYQQFTAICSNVHSGVTTSVELQTFNYQIVNNLGNPVNESGKNVVATFDKPNCDEIVVIGAHYDVMQNVEGAMDNATGVATLYMLLSTLAEQASALPCDVVFVAFDAEEYGMQGSQAFVNKLIVDGKLEKVKLMINFECIGGGDNLYVACENKRTTLGDLFLKKSVGCPSTLLEKPYTSGVYNTGEGYGEYVYNSDHQIFREEGVPVALFFSGHFGMSGMYKESSNADNCVINTVFDTFENLNKQSTSVENNMRTVVQTVVDTLLCSEFETALSVAKSEMINYDFWFNNLWPIIAESVIIVVLAVIAIFYYKKLQKKSILSEGEVKTQQSLFSKPKAEDIFSFGDDDNGNSDDIFKF